MKSRLIAQVVVIVPLIAFAQTADNTEHKERLSKHYRLEKPKGAGPFPAVMMVPGCSGFEYASAKEAYNSGQKRLVELGFVTLRVDYLAARNVPVVLTLYQPKK